MAFRSRCTIPRRFGKGLRTSARDCTDSGFNEEKYRGRAFGFHKGLDAMGAIIGPLFAILLYIFLDWGLHPLFIIAFIPALIRVILLVMFVSEKKAKKRMDFPRKFSDFSRIQDIYFNYNSLFA